MNSTLHFHTNNHSIHGIHRRQPAYKPPAAPYVISVLSRSPESHLELSTAAASSDNQIVYKDNWFDRLAIQHLSSSLQSATGVKSKKSGYDGFVEASTVAYRNFTASQQREVVMQTLQSAFPRPILNVIKTVLPNSQFAREYFAVFTTIFFAWLVGPCEVKESEFEGKMEKNVVHIKKCRFLEGTNCVGMCTNLCKMPSQEFIKDSLGIPFNMVPNFDDMSCDMIFGEQPPLPTEDPAFLRPCYKLCKEQRKHPKSCPTGIIEA